MWIDLSHNGSLMDEATMLTAMGGIVFGIIKVWQVSHRNAKALDEVKETLNNVDGTPTQAGETSMGYRVVRIEQQVDSIQHAVNDLAGTMMEHVQWEQKRSDRIDERLAAVEDTLTEVRECMETHHPEAKPAPKKRRPPRKSA
jgi:uncharacterized protein YoxC